jgi:serine/threonine protein kinase
MNTDRIGDLLASRYRLEAVLGQGGMAVVYSAQDHVLGRKVALKLIRDEFAQDGRRRANFTREARILAQLSSNPHILAVYDFGLLEDGQPYIVAEHLRGRVLKSMLKDTHKPSRTWVLDVGAQVASALVDMHANGVAHRDLNPGNIFIVQTETIRAWAKLIDFGLSWSYQADAAGLVSASPGAIEGTLRYLAPEAANGQRASEASDIYAFGLTLFELATGVYPYAAESAEDLLRAHRSSRPLGFPPEERPFPPSFQDLVFAMLEKDPSRRPSARRCFQSLGACSQDLDRAKGS